MPTLAEIFNIANRHDRVCLTVEDFHEGDDRPHSFCLIAAVHEVTEEKIVVGDGGDLFTTTFAWTGEAVDDGRLKGKRIPASELERLGEFRIQGVYAQPVPWSKVPP